MEMEGEGDEDDEEQKKKKRCKNSRFARDRKVIIELDKGLIRRMARRKCIRYALLKSIEDGEKEVSEASLNIVKNKFEREGSDNIEWRLLNFAPAPINKQEYFGTIVDPSPSKSNTDLITKMVSGSESTEHNYTDMYCAILTLK